MRRLGTTLAGERSEHLTKNQMPPSHDAFTHVEHQKAVTCKERGRAACSNPRPCALKIPFRRSMVLGWCSSVGNRSYAKSRVRKRPLSCENPAEMWVATVTHMRPTRKQGT